MGDFKFYSNMSNLDFSPLIDSVKDQPLQKIKKCRTTINGVELKAQTNFNLDDLDMDRWLYYDAHDAINSIYRKRLEAFDFDTRGIFPNPLKAQYGPNFDYDKLTHLSLEESSRRKEYILSVAKFINNKETMEAIINAAAKKKNGTYSKNKKILIASSGLASFSYLVYAIYGIPKSDTHLSIRMEWIESNIGDNEKWDNDFISTYHEGLPLSEKMKEIVNAD